MMSQLIDVLAFWVSYSVLVYSTGFVVLGLIVLFTKLVVRDMTSGKHTGESLHDRFFKLYPKPETGKMSGFPLFLFYFCSAFFVAFASLCSFVEGSIGSYNEMLLNVAGFLKHVALPLIPVAIYFVIRKWCRALFQKFDAIKSKLDKL